MWKSAIFRRKKLGMSSCRGMAQHVEGMSVVRNWVEAEQDRLNDCDIVIRWGCTSNIPIRCVLNTSASIHEVANKAGFRAKLWDNRDRCGGAIPFFNIESTAEEISEMMERWGALVIRPQNHSRGRNIFKVSNLEDFEDAVQRAGRGFYGGPFIDKMSEFRVTFVQGRVAWVAKKTPGNPEDVGWNVANGGRFDNVRWGDWPLRAIRISHEAFCLTDLDFGAVDVMVDEEGDAWVLEINSAPSQTSPYRISCMGKCFQYIMEKEDKSRIPLVEERGDWKKFIHPALSDRAKV